MAVFLWRLSLRRGLLRSGARFSLGNAVAGASAGAGFARRIGVVGLGTAILFVDCGGRCVPFCCGARLWGEVILAVAALVRGFGRGCGDTRRAGDLILLGHLKVGLEGTKGSERNCENAKETQC